MDAPSQIEFAIQGFAERGRSVVSTHVVDLAASDLPGDVRELSAGGATHLEVVVADGPFGTEVLVQPRVGRDALPGELYAQIPGAFGAPCAYDNSHGRELSWVSPHAQVQEYLRTHQFGAPALPGGQRSGEVGIDYAWTVQLSALAADQSLLVCQIDGTGAGIVANALVTVDQLASVTRQCKAAGPDQALHALRFGVVVGMALSGQLDAPPAPAPSPDQFVDDHVPTPEVAEEAAGFEPEVQSHEVAAVAPAADLAREPGADADSFLRPTPVAHDGTVGAVEEALGRYAGKRVTVGQIVDQKKLKNVLAGVARGIDPDEICGFVDTGVRANGKAGVVFTETSMFFSGSGERRQFDYAVIESFELEAAAVVLNGTDGSRAKISTAGQTLAVAEAVAAAKGVLVSRS